MSVIREVYSANDGEKEQYPVPDAPTPRQQYDTKLAALDALEAPGRKGPQKVIPYDIRKTSQK